MRLSIFSTMAEAPWGGSEELWAATAIAALHQGWQVQAFLPKFDAEHPKRSALLRAGLTINFWTHDEIIKCDTDTINVRNNSDCGGSSTYKTLLENKPDLIIISHGGLMDIANGHFGLLSGLWSSGVPYVVIVQANTESYWPNDLQRPILKNYLACALDVVFVSRQNLETASRQLTQRLTNAVVWQQPVNLPRLASIQWPNNPTLQLASVARLDVLSKGQDMLLEVLSRPIWTERKWRLNLYGVGPSARYLQEQALSSGIGDRVRFHGQVVDISEVWKSNHVLVMPSRIEGTPLALLEALCCGRPAVVSDVGGSADWLITKKTGFISKTQRIEHLTEAMEELWVRRNQLAEIGKAAALFMNESFHPRPGETLFKYLVDRLDYKPKPSAVSSIVPVLSLIRIVTDKTCVNLGEDCFSRSDVEVIYVVADSCAGDIRCGVCCIINRPLKNPAVLSNIGFLAARGKYAIVVDNNEVIPVNYIDNVVSFAQSNRFIQLMSAGLSESGGHVPELGVIPLQLWRQYGGFPASSHAHYREWFWSKITSCGYAAETISVIETISILKRLIEPPRVTVVVTCFNYSRYLERCIDSVINQDFDSFEIIIINDGSTDVSPLIADWMSQLHPEKIKVHHQVNSGQPAISRNNGIQISRGDFILPLDADDWIAPSMIRECVCELDSNPTVGVAYTDAVYCNESGSIELHRAGEFSVSALRENNRLNCCSMFRKNVWSALGGYRTNVRGYEDWDFWLATAAAGVKGNRIPKPLFFYRLKTDGVYSEAVAHDKILRARIIVNNPSCYSRHELVNSENFLIGYDTGMQPVQDINSEKIKGLSELIHVLFKQQRWLDCAKKCQELLAIQPENTNALMFLGDSLSKRNELSKAAEIYKKVLDLDPFDSRVKAKIDALNCDFNGVVSDGLKTD